MATAFEWFEHTDTEGYPSRITRFGDWLAHLHGSPTGDGCYEWNTLDIYDDMLEGEPICLTGMPRSTWWPDRETLALGEEPTIALLSAEESLRETIEERIEEMAKETETLGRYL